MLTLLLEIHFWTFRDEMFINNNDFGTFNYHCKRENVKSLLYYKKKQFAIDRHYHWFLSNKKPHRLRQSLQELEEMLASHRLVRFRWLNTHKVILVFNSGTIAYVGINPYGDIISIYFDKALKDGLLSLHISDILNSKTFSLCCYNDPQLTLIYYSKPTLEILYKKISELDPCFSSINLPGPSGRRLARRLSVNKTNDVISVWWKYSKNDMFPWSPNLKEIDRANILLYLITGSKVELICYYRSEPDLLDVTFGAIESLVLYVVEQNISTTGDISIEISTFEIVKCSRLKKRSVVRIPMQSNVCCLAYSHDRNNLLLGCSNSFVVLFNQVRALTHTVRTAFVPTIITWHAGGYLVAVANVRGQIQCFDFTLGPIKMQFVNEDVSSSNIIDMSVYLTQTAHTYLPTLGHMEWSPKNDMGENSAEQVSADDVFLLVSFNNGPLVILRLFNSAAITPNLLVSQYLNANQVDKAINVLLAVDWDTSPNLCCSLLEDLSSFIIISDATPIEKYFQMQMVLNSFHSPVRPINHSIEAEFYKPVRNISRRLFQYLLRFGMYDSALNVALQLNEHDLFMDLHFCAKSVDNTALAAVAWKKAEQVLVEDVATMNLSSGSENCSCLCSECNCESDENSDFACINKNNPVQQLSSSTALSHHSRASLAAIIRVNPSQPIDSENISKNKENKDSHHFSKNQVRESSVSRDAVNVATSTNSVVFNTLQKNTCTPTSTSASSVASAADGIVEMLHQAGLAKNKSIKVIHFGVV